MDFQTGMKINVYTEAQANPITVGGGVTNTVDRYVQHPQFNRDTLNNDISLLHLSTPLQFKSNVSPACLPWNMVSSDFSGINVLASGWGTTKPVPVGADNTDEVSSTLLEVTLPVLSTAQCQQYLSTSVNQNNICTYLPGKDTCQGDSGGSIDYQGSNSLYYSIGVVSWGNGCAQQNNPGVYTKVTNYLSWIQTTTADNFCKA
jgi:secreted trypsin-like serine protease